MSNIEWNNRVLTNFPNSDQEETDGVEFLLTFSLHPLKGGSGGKGGGGGGDRKKKHVKTTNMAVCQLKITF